MQLLLDAGAEIEAKGGFYDSTPLFQAAEMGHVEVCRLLVARGAKLNAPSNKGSTAVHVAAWRGRLEAIRFLLDAGAEAREGSAGDHSQTPLHMAIIHGKADVARELARRLGPEALSVRAEFDLKAVHFAALYGQVEVMRFLLDECRVSVEEPGGKTESTPLYQACEKGHCAVAAELVARGARINAKSKHGATVCARAAEAATARCPFSPRSLSLSRSFIAAFYRGAERPRARRGADARGRRGQDHREAGRLHAAAHGGGARPPGGGARAA